MSKLINIVGAGWSGLYAAYLLAKQGYRIRLFDNAPSPGGRARSVNILDTDLDNGQHIAIGAYSELLALLKELDIDANQAFLRIPLQIKVFTNQNFFEFKLNNKFIANKLNLVYQIIINQQLTWLEKYYLIKLFITLAIKKFNLQEDVPLLEFLTKYQQSTNIIKLFWEPIACAACTTPINELSSQIFCNVLKDTFFSPIRGATDWLLPKKSLSNIIPLPIVNFLEANQHQCLFSTRVKSLLTEEKHCLAVQTSKGMFKADATILAIPAYQASRILPQSKYLQSFFYQEITTIYYQLSDKCNLNYPMIGIVDKFSYWIFDRSFASQANILSIAISATSPELLHKASKDELAKNIFANIKRHYPLIPSFIKYKVITEKRAAHSVQTNIQLSQPDIKLNNLYLAGDYSYTKYPASLESSLRAGKRVSESVFSRLQ